MRNSGEFSGSDAREAPHPDAHEIRRLTVSTCVLMVTTVCTLFILHYARREEDERVIRATRIAEETLTEVIEMGEAAGAGNSSMPGTEWIVSKDTGERFIREVEVSAREGGARYERVTVTVGWETIGGRNCVQVHGWLPVAESDRAVGFEVANPGQIREALSP